MNPALFNWEVLLSGVQFLLGIQLILVACIHFIYKPKHTSLPLAFLCLIHGLWFFKCVFDGYWADDLWLFLLIGPGKPIFAGTLLLFYYKLYSSQLTRRYVLSHLLAPVAYYVLLIVFRFFLVNDSPVVNQALSLFFTVAVFIIFWYYFFITRKELRTHTRKKLIPKAYKKVMFLFYSLYFFLLQVPVWDMLRNIVGARVLPEGMHEIAAYLYHTIFIYVGEYMSYTYLHILGYFLFLYAMSEVAFFKRLFLPKDTLINQNTLNNKAEIDHLIHQVFTKDKLFKKPELSLDTCASALGITKKELIDYLKFTHKGAFKDFINKLRVEEFKTLVRDKKFVHYDLVGLAQECGFKSKSTFFRVFKEMEGLTPNQFKNSKE